MSILIDQNTKVLVQGITGRDGSFHTASMLEYGTNIVCGVTPGKGGQKVGEVPVYNSIKDARAEQDVNCSIIYVPAKFASAAIKEAADNKIPLIICITEGVPINEMLENYYYVQDKGVRLIGPNCPGLISPGKCKVGIMPGRIHRPGNIGVISRSGTLTYEFVYNLTMNQMGQSTCVGVGGDSVVGTGYTDLLAMFEKDPGTDAIVLIGEIGGEEEEKAAEYIQGNVKKPVVSFISGRSAPADKKMGHAGAIVSQGRGTAKAKVDALNKVGIPVADCPSQISRLLKDRLGVA